MFTIFVILGGIIFDLRDQRARVACALKPSVRALQVSCLAAQALGVQFYSRDVGQIFNLPFAVACIVVGVAGLGALSLFCDCRDDELGRTNL
ncbi:MAG: hypothetical protein HZC40_07290 [Chloroflexi bacterium]|nr:hypothetical protein [Chloroflexota bacterium]